MRHRCFHRRIQKNKYSWRRESTLATANRGVVVNIDKTVNAIKDAVAQRIGFRIQVNSVNVGIAGDHIRSMPTKGNHNK